MFTKSLADIYDSQAQKFSSTRRKHRPEMDHIIRVIDQKIHKKKRVKIIEVGCGDGRLLDAVCKKSKVWSFSYIGIDVSQGLLNIARQKTQTKNQTQEIAFICSDMISYLQSCEQSSVDIIIGVASIQHLFPQNERQRFFNLAKKVLKTGGVLILTNRARSDRAKEKYSRPRHFHLRQWIQTRRKRTSGDQMIPWTDPGTRKVHQRYYHFFSLSEMKSYLAEGRNIHTLAYVDRHGQLTQSSCQARNSLVISTSDE